MGLELLAEAGNYAAFQRLYGGGSPYLTSWPYGHPQTSPHISASSPIDLYYRQAAAAAVLQKPLSYRMYPTIPTMPASGLSTMPVAPTPISHLSASNSLTSLSNYYQTATQSFGSTNSPSTNSSLHNKSPSRSEDNDQEENRKSVEIIDRSCSPQLNPGSPPERLEGKVNAGSTGVAVGVTDLSDNEADDEDDAIEVWVLEDGDGKDIKYLVRYLYEDKNKDEDVEPVLKKHNLIKQQSAINYNIYDVDNDDDEKSWAIAMEKVGETFDLKLSWFIA